MFCIEIATLMVGGEGDVFHVCLNGELADLFGVEFGDLKFREQEAIFALSILVILHGDTDVIADSFVGVSVGPFPVIP